MPETTAAPQETAANPAETQTSTASTAASAAATTATTATTDTGKGSWPENWRELIAGDDKKELQYLQRFSAPADYHKSGVEARKKISAGEFAKPLAKDAKPEEVQAWRQANGIPEKPEGYFEKLPNGLVIGEDDKELFASFATDMHALHAPPAMIHKAVEWYSG